jgi:hypothetical protein
MQGIDIEEVRRAGKPKAEIVVRTNKTIRYPTEARTLQQAIDMCVAGASPSALLSTAFPLPQGRSSCVMNLWRLLFSLSDALFTASSPIRRIYGSVMSDLQRLQSLRCRH